MYGNQMYGMGQQQNFRGGRGGFNRGGFRGGYNQRGRGGGRPQGKFGGQGFGGGGG